MIKLNLFLSFSEIGVWSKEIKELRQQKDSRCTKVIYQDGEWDKVTQSVSEIIELIKESEKKDD